MTGVTCFSYDRDGVRSVLPLGTRRGNLEIGGRAIRPDLVREGSDACDDQICDPH